MHTRETITKCLHEIATQSKAHVVIDASTCLHLKDNITLFIRNTSFGNKPFFRDLTISSHHEISDIVILLHDEDNNPCDLESIVTEGVEKLKQYIKDVDDYIEKTTKAKELKEKERIEKEKQTKILNDMLEKKGLLKSRAIISDNNRVTLDMNVDEFIKLFKC